MSEVIDPIELVLDGLRKGLPEYSAVEHSGISFTTWWRRKNDTPGLAARVQEAKRGRIILYEDALHKAALKGSVTACLVLLRKESREWKELLDGSIAPSGEAIALGNAAAAGAAAIINMLSQEKRERIKAAMMREDILVIPPPSMNGHSTNGNGYGPGH